jgi:hypothetical protein
MINSTRMPRGEIQSKHDRGEEIQIKVVVQRISQDTG